MRSLPLVPALIVASATPAPAFVVEAWTQETCSAYSYTEDFDITGCHAGAGITSSIVTRSNANPGDATSSISPNAKIGADASIPATLDHNGVSAHVEDDADQHSAAASSAVLALTVRNDDAAPVPLDFEFRIDSGMVSLFLEDFATGNDDPPIADVTAEIWCESCVQNKLAWHYRALYASYNVGNQFGVVNDLLDFWDPHGIGKPTWTSVDGGSHCDPNPPYDCTHEATGTLAAPFHGTIPIGTIDPGATATIRYTLRARAYAGDLLDPDPAPADPPSAAGNASFSDPFGVGEVVFINGTPLSTLVPEPAPAAGAVAALAALVACARQRGRRRRRSTPVRERGLLQVLPTKGSVGLR